MVDPRLQLCQEPDGDELDPDEDQLRVGLADHGSAARLDDAGLLPRDVGQLRPGELGVVEGDVRDHGDLGVDHIGGVPAAEHALELAAQAGLKKKQGQWLRGRGNTQIMAGRYDQGLEDHRAALQVLEAIGAQTPLLDALHDMGELLLMLGDPVSAEQYFRRAMTLARDMDMPRIVALNQLALGDLQYRHQRLDAAAALYKQALQRGQAAAWLKSANRSPAGSLGVTTHAPTVCAATGIQGGWAKEF